MLLFGVFVAIWMQAEERVLLTDANKTITSVSDQCNVLIMSVAKQNNLLTSNTRMSISLRNILNQNEMSYSDSVFMSALRSVLNSMVESNSALDNIMFWLDDAPRVFSSSGNGILQLENAQDVPWLALYEQMQPNQSNVIIATRTELGAPRVTIVRRMLL